MMKSSEYETEYNDALGRTYLLRKKQMILVIGRAGARWWHTQRHDLRQRPPRGSKTPSHPGVALKLAGGYNNGRL